jgi:hypothetical protein
LSTKTAAAVASQRWFSMPALTSLLTQLQYPQHLAVTLCPLFASCACEGIMLFMHVAALQPLQHYCHLFIRTAAMWSCSLLHK